MLCKQRAYIFIDMIYWHSQEELYFCQIASHMMSTARSLMLGFDDEVLGLNAAVLLGLAQWKAVQQTNRLLANYDVNVRNLY